MGTVGINLRSGVLFSGERESVAAQESAVALPHFRAPPKKERLIAGYVGID